MNDIVIVINKMVVIITIDASCTKFDTISNRCTMIGIPDGAELKSNN